MNRTRKESCALLSAWVVLTMGCFAVAQCRIPYPPGATGVTKAWITPAENLILVMTIAGANHELQCIDTSGTVQWVNAMGESGVQIRFFGTQAIILSHLYDAGISIMKLNWRSGELTKCFANSAPTKAYAVAIVDMETILAFYSTDQGSFVTVLHINKNGLSAISTHKCRCSYDPRNYFHREGLDIVGVAAPDRETFLKKLKITRDGVSEGKIPEAMRASNESVCILVDSYVYAGVRVAGLNRGRVLALRAASIDSDSIVTLCEYGYKMTLCDASKTSFLLAEPGTRTLELVPNRFAGSK